MKSATNATLTCHWSTTIDAHGALTLTAAWRPVQPPAYDQVA